MSKDKFILNKFIKNFKFCKWCWKIMDWIWAAVLKEEKINYMNIKTPFKSFEALAVNFYVQGKVYHDTKLRVRRFPSVSKMEQQ